MWIYAAIDSVGDTLRRTVPRDSWAWNTLRAVRDISVSIQRNPINKRRWIANHKKFESIIKQYSKTTDDFFVMQVGACDGVMQDPLHKWIKKYRWRGILVEPQKREFERLKVTYRDESDNLVFENVAIAEDNGLRPLYKLKDDEITEDWERGIPSLLPKLCLGKQHRVTTEMVQCVTFDTLLNRHRIRRIDLLQIDVEGYDYELIKLFDFRRIKPRLIRYEHRILTLSDKKSCKEYLIKNGYKILEMKFDTGAVLRHS